MMSFKDFAIELARDTFGRGVQNQIKAVTTHWQVWDAPTTGGTVRAACGERVLVTEVNAEPTCPTCRAKQAEYDGLDVA